MTSRLNRRQLLRLLGATPFAIACGAQASGLPADDARAPVSLPEDVTPVPEAPQAAPVEAPVQEPVPVRAAGEETRLLMAGTDYETPLYIYTSGRQGKTAFILGGVHGNEPGGWVAADWVAAHRRPENGVLIVIPRANRVAVGLFERTTDALADLNRSYPGFSDGRPMERMAAEIVAVLGEFEVDLVHDMHESWAFYKDRQTNGTAFIGQTVATGGDGAAGLAATIVPRVNATIRAPHEEFFLRNLAMQQHQNLPRQTTNVPAPGRGTSSLGLNRFVPGVMTLLVEMGQQQSLDRRVALHVQVLDEALRELGIGTAQV